MEETPKVSIIVPIYNVEPYLRQCLDSLVNQTYKNIEIICVDDGSVDVSGTILDEYAKVDNRIIAMHIVNNGVSSARNTALAIASGQYIMFVDGDDWIEPDTCEISISGAEKNNADVVMWSYVREFDGRSLPKKISLCQSVFCGEECRDLHRHMFGLIGNELSRPENADALSTVWGKLYRNSIICEKRIAFSDLNRIGTYEDGLFNIEYFLHVQKVVYIDKYLNHYRKNTGMTSKYRPKLSEQWRTLFLDMRKYIACNELGNDYVEALNNRISLSIIGLGLNAISLPNYQAIQEIKRIISGNEYRAAIRELPMKYFPLHWWVFFACCKMNFALGVFVLLKSIDKMRG